MLQCTILKVRIKEAIALSLPVRRHPRQMQILLTIFRYQQTGVVEIIMVELKAMLKPLGLAAVALGMTAGAAQASDLFRLDAPGATSRVVFESPRNVRICIEDDTPVAGLSVEYASGSSDVEPGSCATFTAAEFVVKPAGRLASGWAMVGTSKTIYQK